MTDATKRNNARRRDLILAGACGVFVAAMVGLAYASVPFYDWFCRATGFGGRPQVATAGPAGTDAVLQVSDTGPGIPAEELPRIFDRFWRGRGAAHISGSGIGLAVGAELARAHGGTLEAHSEPGHGAQLTLTLPRA